MSKYLRVTLLIVVLAVIGCTSSFVLFARHYDAPIPPAPAVPEFVERTVYGTYSGTIYLQNNRKNGYLTTLYLNQNKTFQLVSNEKPLRTGTIEFWIIPEKDDLGVGRVTLQNEKEQIEIFWHRNIIRDVLKIRHAKGAKKFRFCSQHLTDDECFGSVSAQ